MPRDNPFDPGTEVLQLRIESPPDSAVYRRGEPIRFEVSSFTGFDGLAAAVRAVDWRSSIAGFLSDSTAFSLDNLPSGNHRITVTVQDSSGRRGARSFILTVLPTPPFGVRITVPPADTAFMVGTVLHPAAVEYNATGSTVHGRLWSFGAGSGIADFHGSDPGVVTWNNPGDFLLVYQIADNQGRLTADTVGVQVVSEAVPPYVVIVSPPDNTTLNVGDSVFIEALEIETTTQISFRRWDYPPGSGLESLNDIRPTAGWRRFMRTGTFELIYRVRDKLGQSAADTVTVTVLDTIPSPQAVILNPSRDTTVARGAPVIFSATDSDSWGVISGRAWSWGAGSGLDSTLDTGRTPGEKIFLNAGVFTVRYVVFRANGTFGSDSVLITVTPNELPVVSITSLSADTSIVSGERVPIAGSASDPDGSVARIEWSLLEPDGELRMIDVSSPPVYLRLAVTGVYRLYFRAWDNRGASSADSLRITILPGPPNSPPLARIVAPSVDTTVGAWAPVVFLGQDSDPDGFVEIRQWNFGAGSGVASLADTSASAGPKLFTVPGTFPVTYTVHDNRGESSADTLRLTVLPNNRPTAEILFPMFNTTISAGGSVQFIGLAGDSDGFLVSRQWNYGAGSGIDATADTINVPGDRVFNIPGVFNVTFTVRDNLGAYRADTVRVTVNP